MKQTTTEMKSLNSTVTTDEGVVICTYCANISASSPFGNPQCNVHNQVEFAKNEVEIKTSYDAFLVKVEKKISQK